jgi:hypothetical protein
LVPFKTAAFPWLYGLIEKRQALVHPVIDTAVVVGKLLVAMRDAKLI